MDAGSANRPKTHGQQEHPDISEFRSAVAQLKSASGASQAEAAVQALTERMLAFEARLTLATSRLPELENHLISDTAKMASEFGREREIHGGVQRSVERGQISVAIHQLGVDAAQVRAAVDADLAQLHPVSQQLVGMAGLTLLGCTPKTGPARAPLACVRFLEVQGSFDQAMEDGKGAFAKFDAVWDREYQAQVKLMQDSDAAVN